MLRSKKSDSLEFQIESSRSIGTIYHVLLQESFHRKSSDNKKDSLVHQMIQDMESRYDHDWNLLELSNQYFLSVPQLIRRFKAQTGMPPHTYLMTLRLQAAEMHLKYTNLSVDEIAKKVVFPVPAILSSNFENLPV